MYDILEIDQVMPSHACRIRVRGLPGSTIVLSCPFLAFAKAVVFRGAGLEAVWIQLALMGGLGLAFFAASLALFRRSMNLAG